MTAMSREEENYVRIGLLITGLSSKAVRVQFDAIFPPARLQLILDNIRSTLEEELHDDQLKLMFPGVADSKKFDVTLMIYLIGKSSHWETLRDDLCKIKNERNKFAHLNGSKIDDSYFTSAWNDISNAVRRLGGSAIYKDCQDLKIKILDRSNHEIMLEIQNFMAEVNNLKKEFEKWKHHIDNLIKENEKMGEEIQCLKVDLEAMTKEIPTLNASYEQKTKGRTMLKPGDEKKIQEIKQQIRELQQKLKEIEKLNSNQELNAKEMGKLKDDHEQMRKDIENLKPGDETKTQDIEELNKRNEQQRKDIEKLKTDQENIRKKIEKMQETVPWNIREQMTKKIENWKEKNQMFVETRAAYHVLQCIQTNSCVTVTGSSGVGKTFTVRHVALQMADNGYDILPVTNPEDIVRFHNPNKKTLYVIDDLCGIYTLNQTYRDKWKTMHTDIKDLMANDDTKIIASCRLQVYQDKQFKSLSLFTACECNMLLQDMALSFEEKYLIAEKYINDYVSKISQYIELYDFFPLLCELCNEQKELNVVDFFKDPFSVYKEEIEKLISENAYGKYCALVLCVMFNNCLKEEWLTGDVNQDIKHIIKDTCDACSLNRGTPRLVLKHELDSLIRTFLKKEDGCFRTIHDKLFDFLSFYFGNTHMIQCIIKNGHDQLISERFSFKKNDDSYQFTTIVPDKFHDMYIERMVNDWSKGKVVTVFTNINMKSREFRSAFLKYLQNLDITFQQQLASTCDKTLQEPCKKGKLSYYLKPFFQQEHDDNVVKAICTPLQWCCTQEDTNMVEWLCSRDADVNCCSINDESPLYIACERGYTKIVDILVKNNANINTCTLNKESPLLIACASGYTNIVKKLVANGADINMCTEFDESPLYIACQRGYTSIVTVLVDNKANVNKCTKVGLLPLHVACDEQFKEIVDKLVDNKAEINTCTRRGESPLFIACYRGCLEIVTKLLDNKAVINTCTNWGESPLCTACREGFNQIVEILISKGADHTICDRHGQSPLDIARLAGHDKIVDIINQHS